MASNPILTKLLSVFAPGSTMDNVGRLWTPGGTQNPPDPMYMNRIASAFTQQPAQQQSPGVGYAQQLAEQHGDVPTSASMVGIRSRKKSAAFYGE